MIGKEDLTTKVDRLIKINTKPISKILDIGIEIDMIRDRSVEDLMEAVDGICDYVAEKGFRCGAYDVALAYYLIKLFTNIPIPINNKNNGSIDYNKCYQIAVILDLKDELCKASTAIAKQISFIERHYRSNHTDDNHNLLESER